MRFKMELSTKSVDNLLKMLKMTEAKIRFVVSAALQQLADMGVAHIGQLLTYYGLGDTELARTIELIKVNDNHYRIRATGKQTSIGVCQAVLIEFGTGVKGEQQPHQLAAEVGYKYDINAHGNDGWYYPSSEQDRNPKKYVTKEGDIIAWTKGMPSRPFMYNSTIFLESEVQDVLRQIIKELV